MNPGRGPHVEVVVGNSDDGNVQEMSDLVARTGQKARAQRYLQRLAAECVQLMENQYDRQPDWSPESHSVLDEVCAPLLADGPLTGERLDLWSTGRRIYRRGCHPDLRRQVDHPRELSQRSWRLRARRDRLPFRAATRVLTGEPYKSLTSFMRGLPIVADRSQNHTGS